MPQYAFPSKTKSKKQNIAEALQLYSHPIFSLDCRREMDGSWEEDTLSVINSILIPSLVWTAELMEVDGSWEEDILSVINSILILSLF